MRLTTWNVNGVRNPLGYAPWNTHRTFTAMFDILQADIVVMQELKIQRKDLGDDMVLLDGWDCYFSLPKHKKGYSGVGIYTRNAVCAPIKAEEGLLGVLNVPGKDVAFRDLPGDESIGGYPSEQQIEDLGVDPLLLDSEGRCVCLEFPAFVLFGVYSPANSNGLRDDFRYGFICALDCRIRNLVAMGKNVVLVGDLNVSRCEMDTASAVEDMRKEGITHDEYISTPNRRIFNQLIIGGEVIGERDEGRGEEILWDVVREQHPDRKGMFTHWEQKINARPGNFGSRIDFVLASRAMGDWFCEANIQEGLMGSDHCPVYGVFNDQVELGTSESGSTNRHLLDIMNPPGYYRNGKREKAWSIKNVPAFSAKLMPEFDKRRSIKDMFKKPSMPRSESSSTTQHLTNGTANEDLVQHVESTPATNAPGSSRALDPAALLSPSPTKPGAAAPPSIKRKASDPPANKSGKKAKSITQTTNGKIAGQQSLKGFFASKAPSIVQSAAASADITSTRSTTPMQGTCSDAAGAAADADGNLVATSTASTNGHTIRHSTPDAASPVPSTSPASKPESHPPPSPAVSTDGSVHDPIEAKNKWSALMHRPAAPLCEHGEPCKSMLTKKKGENQGRSFFMCARPLGPSGSKERGSQWRCPTFIWCSEVGKDKG